MDKATCAAGKSEHTSSRRDKYWENDVCFLSRPDVPSNPYSVRLSAVSQRLATVTFMKPDSHGGVPISYYLVQYKEVGSQDWRDVKSHSVQSESNRQDVALIVRGVCSVT